MCCDCSWQDVAEDIQILLEDNEYDFASDTLEGILEWVEENEHVTDNQVIAVDNIKDSV